MDLILKNLPPHINNYFYITKYICFHYIKICDGKQYFCKVFETMI